MKLIFPSTLSTIALFSLITGYSQLGHAELIPYQSTPGAESSNAFFVSVDGRPLLVEKFGDVSYARFMFSDAVEVAVKAKQPIATYVISPQSYQVKGSVHADTLTFALTEPRSLILTINNAEKLFILADKVEENAPALQDPGVVNLAGYLAAGRDPATPVTAEFQKAIDETSSRNNGAGGILFVGNGEYHTGQLKLCSNVHLYLQSGALIKALPDFALYPLQGTSPRDSSFIFMANARNVKISGRGVIDGNGLEVRTRAAKANIKLLRGVQCSGIEIEGVYFRNSSRWSVHFLCSEEITLRGIKLINDLRAVPDSKKKVHEFLVSNTDGIDIDASHHVMLADSFIYTGDDAVSTKVTNYLNLKRPCHDVTIRSNVLWSYKCGLRVGDETTDDLHDIHFENNDIIRADRALALYGRDGGRIFNIQAINNRAEYIGGDFHERFFFFRVRSENKNAGPGSIENVLVKNFFALQPAAQASTIEGFSPAGQVSGVRFENIVISGVQAQKLADIPLEVKEFAEGIALSR